MKTIGQILKDARVNKNYSFRYLEDVTKIKSEFIEAIENQKWESLPSFSTVLGFVKSLSTTLAIDPKMAVAVLKRDYPPQSLRINPKPEAKGKLSWSPRLTFAIAIILVILGVGGYLGYQYYRFISPPLLSVDSPTQNQVISGNSVLVFGTTDIDAKVTVNDQPVIVDNNGKFSINVEIAPDTKEIDIVATSRSGKMSEIKRKILVASS